jgi:hypothetical protein
MLFYPWRDESKLMGSSLSYEKVRTTFLSTMERIEEAMKVVSEENVDEIAPGARQSEDDAEL